MTHLVDMKPNDTNEYLAQELRAERQGINRAASCCDLNERQAMKGKCFALSTYEIMLLVFQYSLRVFSSGLNKGFFRDPSIYLIIHKAMENVRFLQFHFT